MRKGGERFKLTVLGGKVQGVARALQVRARDDQLPTFDLGGAPDHRPQVVWVPPRAVVHAPEDGVREVDTDLVVRCTVVLASEPVCS